ncbi:MAG: hypothetical protein GF353_15880 [Candidatus Lokiarchaeota archaeon]|nr:hypothetical protein [Candidatus Lokiarchaeota archaeon]
MANSKSSESSKKIPYEGLYEIYILYFDEAQGHIPLIIYPRENEELLNNKQFMRPIKYHSIWFLDIEEEGALDHIDVEFKGYTFFGKKFHTTSKRKKRRAGLEEETPETIVIILSLPNDIDVFGDELIRLIAKAVRNKFEEKLFELIEAEIAKEEIIKTPKVKQKIQKGKEIKKDLRNLLATVSNEYFSNAIKKTDPSSIKQQKALSFLALKGIDVSHIGGQASGANAFSNVKLFDPTEQKEAELKVKTPVSINKINFIEDSKELEILVQNNTDSELHEISVKITHVKEFFEKEIMNQTIDFWFPGEELLFISPIIPHIEEYLIFIVEEENKKKLLSKKIDINLLNKVKS